jgi:hypothetical protein
MKSLTQIAAEAGVSTRTLTNDIARGRLRVEYVGRAAIASEADAREYIDLRRRRAA